MLPIVVTLSDAFLDYTTIKYQLLSGFFWALHVDEAQDLVEKLGQFFLVVLDVVLPQLCNDLVKVVFKS